MNTNIFVVPMFIAIFTMFVTQSRATAEWMVVAKNKEFTTYVDRTTIHNSGDTVNIVTMYDYKNVQTNLPDKSFYISIQSQRKFDCVQDKSMMISYSLYKHNMGKGKSSSIRSKFKEWVSVSAKSPEFSLLKIACDKPKLQADEERE
jgi:hypothetical protein